MVLTYIWSFFFLCAVIVAMAKLVFWQDMNVFQTMVEMIFAAAKVSVTLAIGLIGIMAFWLGLLKIGEKAGVISFLSRLVSPFFSRLFPDIPKDHPANAGIMMNFSANMLGLDNSATPLGIKAMRSLQELNPEKDRASNSMIMFLVLNTSGLTIIPMSVMAYRAQYGAVSMTDVFIPILIATSIATLFGLLVVALVQKINLLDPVLLAFLLGGIGIIFGAVQYLGSLEKSALESVSQVVGGLVILTVIAGFLVLGLLQRINVYETFVEGAKEGFDVAIKIIPYLVAMLCAIAAFRGSGAMQGVVDFVRYMVEGMGFDARWVEGMPTALMKPLSGSGARSMMVDAMETHGADSFVGRLSSVFQGSTETIFYTVAVYFGAVGIRNTRYTIVCGLFADLVGVIAAIFVCYMFFG